MALDNQPFKLPKFVAFRDNPFPVNIQVEAGYTLETPVAVEVWFYNFIDEGLVVPVTITTTSISFTFSIAQLEYIENSGGVCSVYIVFNQGEVNKRYVFQADMVITLDGSVPAPDTITIPVPEMGIIKVSVWSDSSNAQIATQQAQIATQKANEVMAALASVSSVSYNNTVGF